MTDATPRRGFTDGPLYQMTAASMKEFFREPIALFWVYGFPLILCVILGMAFRNRPVEKIPVVVLQGDANVTAKLVASLESDPRLTVTTLPEDEARNKLRTAKVALVIVPTNDEPGYSYLYDPNHPESVLAKSAVDVALLRRMNPTAATAREETPNEPGGRYIDFLIPGLLGASLMGGGLWGVGFGIVDMRVKKLLKRLLATPMRKSDFLWSMIFCRVIFTGLQVAAFLIFAVFAYDITVRGNVLALLVVIVLGTVCFAGFGLLVASRVKKIESAHGLMNLVMLPSYLFSGVFFSSANFPDWAQPVISVLPLTALNDALRAIINDGAGFAGIAFPVAVMVSWTVICYAIGAKLFRWL